MRTKWFHATSGYFTWIKIFQDSQFWLQFVKSNSSHLKMDGRNTIVSNSSHLKMDGWNTIVSLWEFAYVQVLCVRFILTWASFFFWRRMLKVFSWKWWCALKSSKVTGSRSGFVFTLNLWGNDPIWLHPLEDDLWFTYKLPIWKGKWSEPNLHDYNYVPDLQGCSICFKSQTIHVWYLYLHLP